jgi:hypothetical protein
MEQFTALPLPLDEWLQIVKAEYMSGFVPAGGGALKLLIADHALFGPATARLAALAAQHRLRAVSLDAAQTRLHMLQDMVFALARALPWQDMVQHYLEALFARHEYPWPQPGMRMSLPALAAAFGVAPGLLARERDRWLSRDIWENRALAQDVRAALLRLCLAQLDPDDPALAEPVLAWLRGEKVAANLLRGAEISGRITRTNARAVLVSLCHWLRQSGADGLLLTIDLRALQRTGAAASGTLRYSPAAVMDTYEVLREIIDDAGHLPGLFVVALADEAIVAGDPRRALAQYAALQMRLWPDVRPGDRQNPLAPLVWIGR